MNTAWYALRRTIPLWNTEKNIPELADFCKRNFIEEVIIKVDTEEFCHGIPSIDWLDDYLPVLHRTKSALIAEGVQFSINPFVTLGHCDGGRNAKEKYPDIDFMVGHDGAQCAACACPLSDGWRNATRELWHRYASIKPNVIWVEDDIRLLNHQPVSFGCFCPIHMKLFSDAAGEKVAREELVAALLTPGNPHPYRKIWLDLNRDAMNDTVAFLEQCVHEVSPKTKLGLMCSGPTSHAIEGRDWDSFTSTLAGDQPLVARPCMINYNETSPREYYLRNTLHCLPPETIIQTEVENWPFTTYSKSAKFTAAQCALSFLFGADGVTLNIFDHMGTPMSVAPEFGNILKDRKPYFNALAARCKGGKPAGIQLLHAKTGSYHVKLESNAGYNELAPEGNAWRHTLEPLGFPITFDESSTVALSGQAIRGFDNNRIEQILSGGVLLDLGALKCLIDMGLGDLVGASIKREFCRYNEPVAAEEYFNTEFGGSERKYLTLTLPDLRCDAKMAEIEPLAGAHIVSNVVDPDAKPVYPFLILFQNRLGGRIAVYPIDMEHSGMSPAFLHPYRKDQLRAVLNWISGDNIPLVTSGGAYPLSTRIDFKDKIILCAFNLSQDDWPSITFDINISGKSIRRIEKLTQDGNWIEDTTTKVLNCGNGIRLETLHSLDTLSLVVLTLWTYDQ